LEEFDGRSEETENKIQSQKDFERTVRKFGIIRNPEIRKRVKNSAIYN
jgi:hypothetical protein